jgi:hypothetical protein
VTTAHVDGVERRSDVAQIADAVGGPAIVWGLAVVLVAAALLALGIWRAWRPAKPR